MYYLFFAFYLFVFLLNYKGGKIFIHSLLAMIYQIEFCLFRFERSKKKVVVSHHDNVWINYNKKKVLKNRKSRILHALHGFFITFKFWAELACAERASNFSQTFGFYLSFIITELYGIQLRNNWNSVTVENENTSTLSLGNWVMI